LILALRDRGDRGLALPHQVPGSFVPPEDQGYLISALMLPDGATLKRTGSHRRGMRQMLARTTRRSNTPSSSPAST
jgi:multidrug efflux pump subunit AcrB